MTSKMEFFVFLVIVFLGFVNMALWYLPTLIALLRERQNQRQCLPLPLRPMLILVFPLELKIE